MARKPRTAKPAASPPQQPVVVISGAVELLGEGETQGKRVTEKGLGVIEVMAANAQSKASIAKALGIDHKTLGRIAERQPEVATALEIGRGALSDRLASGFLKQFEQYGNTTAGIFLAKCVAGWRENDTRDLAPRIGIQINLPDALSMEEYVKRLPKPATVITDEVAP
jgi:hypothetical protein